MHALTNCAWTTVKRTRFVCRGAFNLRGLAHSAVNLVIVDEKFHNSMQYHCSLWKLSCALRFVIIVLAQSRVCYEIFIVCWLIRTRVRKPYRFCWILSQQLLHKEGNLIKLYARNWKLQTTHNKGRNTQIAHNKNVWFFKKTTSFFQKKSDNVLFMIFLQCFWSFWKHSKKRSTLGIANWPDQKGAQRKFPP